MYLAGRGFSASICAACVAQTICKNPALWPVCRKSPTNTAGASQGAVEKQCREIVMYRFRRPVLCSPITARTSHRVRTANKVPALWGWNADKRPVARRMGQLMKPSLSSGVMKMHPRGAKAKVCLVHHVSRKKTILCPMARLYCGQHPPDCRRSGAFWLALGYYRHRSVVDIPIAPPDR